MDKQEIIDEIRRTAAANNGKPLGLERFQRETGLRQSEWYGKHWVKWSDAISEAGFTPNAIPEDTRIADDEILRQIAELIRRLGHFPTNPELIYEKQSNSEFPTRNVIRRRFGSKANLAKALVNFCRTGDFADIIAICEPLAIGASQAVEGNGKPESVKCGYVYLMKSGDFYKIGLSDAPGRREYDLGSHRPEGVEIVHTIKTDDPEGIEAYWHNRFRDKRKRGEWFDLTRDDVAAFKRWVRIR